jgi:hypothetical protein
VGGDLGLGDVVKRQPDIYVLAVAFLSVLGCFTALTIIGSDGTELLRSVLLPLVGALGAVAYSGDKKHDDDPPSS